VATAAVGALDIRTQPDAPSGPERWSILSQTGTNAAGEVVWPLAHFIQAVDAACGLYLDTGQAPHDVAPS
jgi:hypothetical protein